MYLQIDEGFVAHPKTKLFAGKMQDPNAAMYLIKLWTWAVRSSPAGDLTEMNPWSIEETVGYRLLDGKCYAAMVACGFVDEDEPGAPKEIHNWAKRTGGDIVKMENEAGRRRLLRAHNAGKCNPPTCQFHRHGDDQSEDVRRLSADCPPDIQASSSGQQSDDRHQDKTRPVQARQDPDPGNREAGVGRLAVVAETAKPSSPKAPPDPAILTFRCDGKVSEWPLVASQIAKWRELFPSLDVGAECRAALAWVEANPARRKTAAGMPTFLVGWFGRSQNRNRGMAGPPQSGARASPIGYAPVTEAKNYAAGAELFAKETA